MEKFVIGGVYRRAVDRRIVLDLVPLDELPTAIQRSRKLCSEENPVGFKEACRLYDLLQSTRRPCIPGKEWQEKTLKSCSTLEDLERLTGNLFIWFGSGADPQFKIEEADYEVP